MSAKNPVENSDERTVAIGGPNTNQQINDKNKSLQMTRTDFFFLVRSLRVLPIKFMIF
jgi:hypothetical protein